ncbi:MAG: hypothetical protein AAGB00_03590 [Planctomycetota bacterium]
MNSPAATETGTRLPEPGYSAAAHPDAAEPANARPAALPTWLDRWLEAASERLNPILVKETRQALKSPQFVLWFLVLLAACWVVTIGGIAWIGPGVHYAASGGILFLAYYFILAAALVVVVPFAAYRSLASEQEDNTRDVLMVSALTPRQVIDGKIGSATLQIVVYLSALAPCIAFTYLLRGIDLLTILLLPGLAVLASVGLSMLGLVLASATRQRYSQVLTSVALVATLLGVCYWCQLAAVGAVREGYLVYRQPGFWMAVAAGLTAYGCALLLAYFGAAAMNAFASANRSTALRRALFVTQACFVGWIAVAWVYYDLDRQALISAAPMGWVFWLFAGALLTSERPILSERVRRGLPTTPFGRFFTTWFNPGPGTGYLFVAANLASLLLLALAGMFVTPVGRLAFENELGFIVLGAAYVVGMLGVARLIILGLRRFATLSLLGGFLVNFLLLLGSAGLPELIRASVTRIGRMPFSWYDVVSPVRVLDVIINDKVGSLDLQILLIVVPGVSACVLLINTLLAASEIQQTRVPLPQRVIEDDRLLDPTHGRPVNPWGDAPADAAT